MLFALSLLKTPHSPLVQTPPFHIEIRPSSDGGDPHRIVMGTDANPSGHTITATEKSLMRDGKPWLPMMGEFHYSRYPASQWRDELLKMKAGGIDIVSCYVFWIHHNEVKGTWDWTGQRDLRRFVQTCAGVGLPMLIRIGPWDHGEVRNGGFPDWLQAAGYRLRSEDPGFLKEVRELYAQILTQLRGQQWKDGGPVLGIQLENEFGGPGSYMAALKKIAVDEGYDVPLFTRTGWPELATPMPFGVLLPFRSEYAEGFWDRTLDKMPGGYWRAFTFQKPPVDAVRKGDPDGNRRYPYLACELGAGMETSYHRRILVNPMDPWSMALVKQGSGNNLPGFYIYHGGRIRTAS